MTLTPILPVATAPASATESEPACGDGSRFQQTLTEVAGRYRADGASRSGRPRPADARTPATGDQSPGDDGGADTSGPAVGDASDPAPGAGPGPDVLLLAQAGVVTGAPVPAMPTVPMPASAPAPVPISMPAAVPASVTPSVTSAPAAATASVTAAGTASVTAGTASVTAGTASVPAAGTVPVLAGVPAAQLPATTPSGGPPDPTGSPGTSAVASPAGDAPAPAAAGAVSVEPATTPAAAATAAANGALPAPASAGHEPAPASPDSPTPVAGPTDGAAAPPGLAAVTVEPAGTSVGPKGAGNAPAGEIRPLRPGTRTASAGVAGLSRAPTPSTGAEVPDAGAPTAAVPPPPTPTDAAAPTGGPSEPAPYAPAAAGAAGATPSASTTAPAPASPASGSPSPATGGPETVPDQVLRHLESVRALRDGGHRTVLRLDPEHLGAVTVTVDVRAGAVRMAVTGGSEALAAVREGIAHLRSALADAGLDLGDVALRPEGLQPAASTSSSGTATSPHGQDVPNGPRPDRGADGSTAGDRRPGRQHDQGPPKAPERVDAVRPRPAATEPTAPPAPGHEPATARRLDVRV